MVTGRQAGNSPYAQTHTSHIQKCSPSVAHKASNAGMQRHRQHTHTGTHPYIETGMHTCTNVEIQKERQSCIYTISHTHAYKGTAQGGRNTGRRKGNIHTGGMQFNQSQIHWQSKTHKSPTTQSNIHIKHNN